MEHINKLVGRVLDISGAPKLSGSERAKRARLELEVAEREEAADIERHRLAAERKDALEKADRERIEREAREGVEAARVTGIANGILFPAQVLAASHSGNERWALINIDHITKKYDVTIVDNKPVAYRIADTGELTTSDAEIPLKTFEVESQLFPKDKSAFVFKLYEAWLLAKLNTLAENAHKDVIGASVLYCSKLPKIKIADNKKYKGLVTVVIEWGEFYVMGMGE